MTPAVVVGEGIAGQAAALALVAASVPVLLLAREPAAHTESFQRHDGLEAALDADDSPGRHLDDCLSVAGEAARPFLEPLVEAAPAIVERLERLDIPFERTRKGALSLESNPGSSRARGVHAGSETARHASRRLAALLLKYEALGMLERLSGWTLIDLVRDDGGRARGLVAQCFASGEIRAFEAHGICLATGGHAGLFMHDTLAPAGLGGVSGLMLRQGARVVHPLRVSQHPFCYRAGGFVRRLPRRLVALGGELDAGLLDLTRVDRAPLRRAAGLALEAHRLATGTDAYSEPVVVVSAPDRTLGGLEVSLDHATAIPGVFAVGGAVASYFGAGTREGVPLTAALFGAERASRALLRDREEHGHESSAARLEAATLRAEKAASALLARKSDDTVFALARDLRRAVGCGRVEHELESLTERLGRVALGDDARSANAALRLWWDLEPAFELVRKMTEAASP